MRRFSKRNSLVTLNEINITPLLDLAFVLLIIFILVSGSVKVEQGIEMNLPQGGKPQSQVDPRDVRTVSVTKQGIYMLGKQRMPLESLVRELVQEHRMNPNLLVEIRLDEEGTHRYSVPLIDRLARNNISRFRIETRGPNPP